MPIARAQRGNSKWRSSATSWRDESRTSRRRPCRRRLHTGAPAAEVAGAYAGPETLTHAAAVGCDPGLALDTNDAHAFFAATGGQIVTGPTLTNVNDFRAILIAPVQGKAGCL